MAQDDRAEPLLERWAGHSAGAAMGPSRHQPAATRHIGYSTRAALAACVVISAMLAVCGAGGLFRAWAPGTSSPPQLRDTLGAAAAGWPFEVLQNPLAVAGEWGVVSRPFPTGAWYTNMAVLDGAQRPGSQPIVALPYGFRNNNGRGMAISYGPTRRSVTPLYQGDFFGSDLVVGTVAEGVQNFSHRISATSPLTLAVDFTGSASREHTFTARLARGAPWVVTEWTGAVPSVTSDFALVSVKAIGNEPAAPPSPSAAEAEAAAAKEEEEKESVAVVNALCSAHKGCQILEASVADGLCCPLTTNGIMLECCEVPPPRPIFVPHPKAVPESAVGDELGPNDLFELKLQTGQTWLASFDEPVSVKWWTNPGRFECTSPYTGALRLAFAHDNDSLLALQASAHGPYPVSSSFRVEEDASINGTASKGATLVFAFEVAGSSAGSGELVTLALPHHIAALAKGSVWHDGPRYDSMKGRMTPIRGLEWAVHEKYIPISWTPPTPPAKELVGQILKSLHVDLEQLSVLEPDAKDLYGFGKQASRLARLALIAEQLDDAESFKTAVTALTACLTPWLTATNLAAVPNALPGSGALVYDEVYGGLVTRQGLADPAADFGNGRYNDHHFQIGYLLYASAVACKMAPDFCKIHKATIGVIARDVTTPPNDAFGKLFPVARCKDLYDGHSWASGLFQMADGKSQESSSESVNAYYAAVLLAEAVGDAPLLNWAKFLLATEVRAVQWYWHVPSNSRIYDERFVASHTMVGVVGATDVNAATWFGANLEYVHGINVIPVTPLTEALLPAGYVAEEYAQLETRSGMMVRAVFFSLFFFSSILFSSLFLSECPLPLLRGIFCPPPLLGTR